MILALFNYNLIDQVQLPIELVSFPAYIEIPLRLMQYAIKTIQYTSLFLSLVFLSPIVLLIGVDVFIYIMRISKLLTNLNQLKAIFNLGKESEVKQPEKVPVVRNIRVQQGVVYEQYVVSG